VEESEITRDTLLRGRVHLLQPRRGLRSSLDPVLLAGFLVPPFGRFLDIGCGSGALSFLLLAHDAEARGVGVEIQPRLAALAEQGASENAFASRFRVVAGDVRATGAFETNAFDLVATNPPFRPVGTGVLPPLSEKALARHEVALTLKEWLDVAAVALRPQGRLAAIFPFDRWEELRASLASLGFCVARSRPVVSRLGAKPQRILVEARKAAVVAVVEPVLEPALIVHDENGYSADVRHMLGEKA